MPIDLSEGQERPQTAHAWPEAGPASESGRAGADAEPRRRFFSPPQLIYRAYEQRLLRRVLRFPVPAHIGIILDGNRRYARSQGITDPVEIYSVGAGKLDDVLEWCSETRIPVVTLWVISPDNLQRSPDEVSGIFSAIEAKLAELVRDPRIHRRRVRVQAIGRLNLIPQSTLAAIRAAEAATALYEEIRLNIAVAYSGRAEIVDAVAALLQDALVRGLSLSRVIGDLSPDRITEFMYTTGSPDPDLIIRTSGEIRLSGFMLWQSVHSEFYFTDVHWPAFRKIDFLRAIRAYQQRLRRFGR